MIAAGCQYVGVVPPRISTRFYAILLLIVPLSSFRPARAQVFDLDKDRVQMVEMTGLWRFHTGDDPSWADPNFDDSGWSLLRADQSWSEQGYKGYGGMAWYRFKVLVPKKQRQLALFIPSLSWSYQVYANGQSIGCSGVDQHRICTLPDTLLDGSGIDQHRIYTVPDALLNTSTISFAIRVWEPPLMATFLPGGPGDATYFGDRDLLNARRSYGTKLTFWSLASANMLLLINILAGLAGLALFMLRSAEREYLWFGASELLTAANLGLTDFRSFYSISYMTLDVLSNCLTAAAMFFFLAFVFTLLKGRKNWLYWSAIVAIALDLLSGFPLFLNWYSIATTEIAAGLLNLPYYICFLALIYQAARRGVPDARLLLGPVALSYAAETTSVMLGVIQAASGTALVYRYFGWFISVSEWPIPFSVPDITDLLMQLSILAILVMRFARTRRDEQRMEAELESARMVQNVLIPSKIPAIAGFAIASVYKPASQVGGDFFQIIPLQHGGILAVIGDVSGKGMPAAMTVSLLVGTVRTLAHFTESPGDILAAMNQRMLARSAGGFTTCLVLRADADGVLTVANAGHIPPYLAGKELLLVNGLPLGLDTDEIYPESNFLLAPGEQLTLLTDGVVEAREKTGALFGFERTTAVSIQPADVIAAAAQRFGQDDDITVLTLARLRVGDAPTAQCTASILSPR
jgi:sigma-B regulation protein RsbU (phosphoserine phosphatase)